MATDEAERQMPADDPEYMRVRQEEEQMEDAQKAQLEADPPPPDDAPPPADDPPAEQPAAPS